MFFVENMESKERILTAVNFSEPDRVPFDLAGTTGAGITKRALEQILEYRGIVPEYQKEFQEFDPIQQLVNPSESVLEYLESDTRRIGVPRIFGLEKNVRRKGAMIHVLDQYHCLWEKDSAKDGGFNQMSSPLEPYETLRQALRNLAFPSLEEYREVLYHTFESHMPYPTNCAWVAESYGPGLVELAMQIRGQKKFFLDLDLDLQAVLLFLNKIADHKIAYWECLAQYFHDNDLEKYVVVAVERDLLGSYESLRFPFDVVQKHILPIHKRVLTFIKRNLSNVKILFHSEGAIRQILPELIEIGVDIVSPVQFTAKEMELKLLKKDFGTDIVFWGGGIDNQETLAHAKSDNVRDEVKRNLDIMAPGGGYVCTPIQQIGDSIPPENFWAFWETLSKSMEDIDRIFPLRTSVRGGKI